MPSLSDKIALVTGASRGIGRAIAQRLGHEGAKVVLTARDPALLESAAAEIEAAGGSAAFLPLDLREPDAPAELARFAQARFGGIDILVNNAGATKRGDFLTLTDEDWKDGYALKFFGAMRLTRAVWPQLKERRGSVVNIAGVGGRTPGAQFTIGGSVNAALLSLTKSLSELGIQDGVQVNAVNPGPVRTARFNVRLKILAREKGLDPVDAEAAMVREMRITRVGEPEDIASLVAYLVSSEARLLQGAFIDIDGGETKTL